MAYGPINQEDFFFTFAANYWGRGDKNQIMSCLLLLTTAPTTVTVIPVARPITVRAPEHPWRRRRSISLPVVRVGVGMSPSSARLIEHPVYTIRHILARLNAM